MEQNGSSRNEPHTYGHLIFDKGAENIQWKRDSLFNKWCWLNWHSACRKMKIDPFLSPCTMLKFKWIKDLNIKSDTLKLSDKKLGKNLEHIGTGEIFLKGTPMTCALKPSNKKSDLMRLQFLED